MIIICGVETKKGCKMNKKQTIEYIQNKIYRVMNEYDISVLKAYLEYYGETINKVDPELANQFIADCYHYESETDSVEINYPNDLIFVEPVMEGSFKKYTWQGVSVYKLARA